MRVLVIGTGGREHALAWKAAESPRCEKVFLHPGNPGAARTGFLPLPGAPKGIEAISTAAKRERVDLVVIGPETLLAEGYADALRKDGFRVVGPGREGARLESSKLFAKQFMQRAKVPTAPFQVARSADELSGLTASRRKWPVALKLDGLAAGKGVVIASGEADVSAFATKIWTEGAFGPGPHTVLVEEFLPGREVSLIGLCDGETFTPLPTATDFKRVGDGDTGPNTGGMGVLSPSPYFTPTLAERARREVIEPVLAGLRREGIAYRGALYVGLMVSPDGTPFVLEFNARFGDPETQGILPRIAGDFTEWLEAVAEGRLAERGPIPETKDASVYVVAAAEGYPDRPSTGDVIETVPPPAPPTQIFYAGVAEESGRLVTAGGRVLGVCARGKSLGDARDLAYRTLAGIRFRGMHFRRDIGAGL